MILHLHSRNKRKQGRNDDSPASLETMDNVMFANGLECKISCKTSKVQKKLVGPQSYVHNLLCPFAYFLDTILTPFVVCESVIVLTMGQQYFITSTFFLGA